MRNLLRPVTASAAALAVLLASGCAAEDLTVSTAADGSGVTMSPDHPTGAITVESFADFVVAAPLAETLVMRSEVTEGSSSGLTMLITAQGEDATFEMSGRVAGTDLDLSLVVVEHDLYLSGSSLEEAMGISVPDGTYVKGSASSANPKLAELTETFEEQLEQALAAGQAESLTAGLTSVSYRGPAQRDGVQVLTFEVETDGEHATREQSKYGSVGEATPMEGTVELLPNGRIVTLTLEPQDNPTDATSITTYEYPDSLPKIVAPSGADLYDLSDG